MTNDALSLSSHSQGRLYSIIVLYYLGLHVIAVWLQSAMTVTDCELFDVRHAEY